MMDGLRFCRNKGFIVDSPRKNLYPILVISGISLTIFSLLGFAAIFGWIPFASTQETVPAQSSVSAVAQHQTAKDIAAK